MGSDNSSPPWINSEYLPLDKMATSISQTMISDAFSWMKFLYFDKISLRFVPKGPIVNNPALV